VFYRDEWHLFYQYYNPEEVDGMQWGHAVSADLLSWTHLPPALAPDEHGQIWSGSAVVDREDASGLFGGRPGLVCLYTYWDKDDGGSQCQGMAYSADGRTFVKWPGNPVIPKLRDLAGHPADKDFRDPKVFRHGPSGSWVMVVAGGKLRVFSSKDLIHWEFESVDEATETECPDLFELPVAGAPGSTAWVLSGGGRWYQTGAFDGKHFTPGSPRIQMCGGPDWYATQTWDSAPDSRRVGISWLFGWGYGAGARAGRIANPFPTGPIAGGCLTIPCELSLESTPDGPRLLQAPVREFNALAGVTRIHGRIALPPGSAYAFEEGLSECLDVAAELTVPPGARVTFTVPVAAGGSVSLGIDNLRKALFIDRTGAASHGVESYGRRYETALAGRAGPDFSLRIVLDRCSLELFADHGRSLMSAFILPADNGARMTAEGDHEGCAVRSMAVRSLRPCINW